MRKEKWWWIAVAVVVSFLIHVVIGWKSKTLDVSFAPPTRGEMEVILEPIAREKPTPKVKEPKKAPVTIAATKPPVRNEPRTAEVRAPRTKAPVVVAKMPAHVAKTTEARAETPKVSTGGVKVARFTKPLPLGQISPTAKTAPPSLSDVAPKTALTSKIDAVHAPNNLNSFHMTNPLAALHSSEETPTIHPSNNSHVKRMAMLNPSLSGGGMPSPSAVLGGHGGVTAPDKPIDDLLLNGGGAGGMKLPRMEPRIGGGGGNPILSVSNPLAVDAIPEEKPGVGAGRGGGEGLGGGGGAGVGRGRGVGTSLLGKGLLSSLHAKPGSGLGAGFGSGRGTRVAGGGRGTGSELPGTGGTGQGYGQGSGFGVGNGFRSGMGSGSSAFDDGGSSGGMRMASNRGIPFGDITGLLRGGDRNGGAGANGGPGGNGEGVGAGGVSGGSGPLHVVYLLDVSGSMRYNDKIVKARAALAKALAELRRGDYFNIICFDKATYPFAQSLIRATPGNVARATDYMSNMALDVHPGTDMSGVLEQALSLKRVSEIFLMSDGEPNGGIMDFDQLREDVRTRNAAKVPIFTLALGVGRDWKGINLMKGMAEDTHGTYHYIDLKGTPRERKSDHS